MGPDDLLADLHDEMVDRDLERGAADELDAFLSDPRNDHGTDERRAARGGDTHNDFDTEAEWAAVVFGTDTYPF